jgi:hypothetical protein
LHHGWRQSVLLQNQQIRVYLLLMTDISTTKPRTNCRNAVGLKLERLLLLDRKLKLLLLLLRNKQIGLLLLLLLLNET